MELTEIRDCLDGALQAYNEKDEKALIEQNMQFLNGMARKGNVFIFQTATVNVQVIANIMQAIRGVEELINKEPELIQGSLPERVELFEKKHICQALEMTNYVKKDAADILGLNRQTLVEKCKRYAIR